MSDHVRFTCNGVAVQPEIGANATLLSVLREQLGVVSVKDGCAPQGQCGCCTVLIDGQPRVSCVTPAARVAGRNVVTIEGLEASVRDRLANAFTDVGGSQCGFCTPGIILRVAPGVKDVDRALAAHLCRCTGWLTVKDAIAGGGASDRRDRERAAARAALEGASPQGVDATIPLGAGGFADDTAPRDALVAIPLPPGSNAPADDAAGGRWVVGETLDEARALAGKVQGRRTTIAELPPLAVPDGAPADAVRLATSWVEPAYLEPDASWCEPGGVPASPLANGGAFGGKVTSSAPHAARELADRYGRTVRVVYSREDCVRLGPKRPPIAAWAVARGERVEIEGAVARADSGPQLWPTSEGIDVVANWREVDVAGPPRSYALRAAGLAEQAVLVAGALGRNVPVVTLSGARADARVDLDPATGALRGVDVHVAAGDPLDEVVLRSYAVGAAHMALGWVLSESIAVDPDTGDVHDLTIRSFGVIRARDVPPIRVVVADDPAPPRAGSSDAVFAAVAAATWNALAENEGVRPDTFPARDTRTARRLRRS